MSLSGEIKRAYGDVMDAYSHTLLSLNAELADAILTDVLNDFRVKSGTDNIVDLASKVKQ
jgi:hypothetical protein